MVNLVTQKTVYDGSNNKVADVKTVYDGTAVTTTLGVPNHDYTIGVYRGNATQSSVWVDTSNTWLNTNNTYNDLGHVLTTTDPGNHTTSYSYGDSWSGATCGVGTNTQAYLTQTSAPDTTNSQGATVHHRSQAPTFRARGRSNQREMRTTSWLAAREQTTPMI